ncbi:MAG: SRPBCC family protein [Phototrophicaceae bacterium]
MMNIATFEESRVIHANPAEVYQLLADYQHGHALILPKPYFVDLRVLEGGFGEGTIIDVDMEVFGVKRTMQMVVTEPEKGAILVEKEEATGTVTHFFFEPHAEGCYLRIRTTMIFGAGVIGFIEKLTTPVITRKIYREELQNIADYFAKVPQTA